MTCKTRFSINNSGIIYNWGWEGNHCKALPPKKTEENQEPIESTQSEKEKSDNKIDPQALEWSKRSYESFQKSDWTETIRTASAAISLDPGFAEPYLNRAVAYYQKGFYEETIQDCNKALEIDPANVNAYNIRSVAYLKNGHVNKAFEDVDKALSIDPNFALAHNNKATIYLKTGEKDKAKIEYEKACSMGLEAACNYYKEITGYLPSEIPQIAERLISESYKSFQQSDWDGVIKKTTEALKINPNSEIAYTNRAGAFANKGLLKEALEDCNSAIRLNPDYGLAYNNRGYVYELMGMREKAMIDYEISCKLGVDKGCANQKKLTVQKSQH